MKISRTIGVVYAGTSGCGGGKCPTLYLTDNGTVLVQGVVVHSDAQDGLDIPKGESLVEIPISAFKNLVEQLDHE